MSSAPYSFSDNATATNDSRLTNYLSKMSFLASDNSKKLSRHAISYFSKWIKNGIKNHFGVEYTLRNDPGIIAANKIIADIWPNIRKKQNKINHSIDSNIYVLEDRFDLLKFDSRTYVLILTGEVYANFILNNKEMLLLEDAKSSINSRSMYFYFFGKNSRILKKRIEDAVYELNKPKGNELSLYSMYGDDKELAFRSIYQRVPGRSLDTIFMEDGVVESICNHIDKYLTTEGTYSGRGIIYKTGILLYGEPGTGKSSLIKALACKYNRDLIVADMTTFKDVGIEALTQSLNADESKYIMALEDIDCIMANRDSENIDKEDKNIVNKLLQFLDSNNSPSDIIFIATTNHIERLDEALLREGRFDIQVKIEGILEDKAREMCKSFNLDDKTIDEVIDEIKDSGIDLKTSTIRQSKLQAIILRHTDLNMKVETIDEDAVVTDTGDIEYKKGE